MFKTTVWIIGASGRVGSSLKKALQNNTNYKVFATDSEIDVTNLEAVEQAFTLYRPNVVINCASISDANYCEEHKVEAFRVNALGARNVAVAARQNNVKMIHLSTDDVFSGEHNRAKNEFDVPTPKKVYGQSKLAGENFVRELNPMHLIIRSSWVYGKKGEDYVSEVLEHAKNNEKFEARIDKISSPTSMKRVSDFIVSMIPLKEYGIYHVSSEGMCSRYQYAEKILETAGYDTSLVIPSTQTDEGATVTTWLENLMMQITGIYEMPEWEDDLVEYVNKLKGDK